MGSNLIEISVSGFVSPHVIMSLLGSEYCTWINHILLQLLAIGDTSILFYLSLLYIVILHVSEGNACHYW